LPNGYLVKNKKWAFFGAILSYGSNQCIITDIINNQLIVDNVIPTPNNYIFLEKPSQIYTNERLVDVISSLGVDGYRFFVIDNEINAKYPYQYDSQLTVCIQYHDYTQHKQAVRAATVYSNQLLDALHRYTTTNPITISNSIAYHSLSAILAEKFNNTFNGLIAAIVTDYVKV